MYVTYTDEWGQELYNVQKNVNTYFKVDYSKRIEISAKTGLYLTSQTNGTIFLAVEEEYHFYWEKE
jgi:hypothetical protein